MKYLNILIIAVAVLFTSCAEEWLEIKRDKKQVVPQTLQDLQALLDHSDVMNNYMTPALGEISTDDFILTHEEWQALNSPEQMNAYIWAKEIYEGATSNSWNLPYQQVFYANLVLEKIDDIDRSEDPGAWDNIKGSALFYRAWAFYQLTQVYAPQFNAATAASDPGIPLRLESDVTINSVRSTVKQTYDRILADLQAVVPLVPEVPLVKTRPGKAAVLALLSKTYLQMEDYDQALFYADRALDAQDVLLDFNQLDLGSNYPFSIMNEEVIFHASMNPRSIFYVMHVNPELYDLYGDNDLRKEAFFIESGEGFSYRGSYNEYIYPFSGIAVDELYLIRAEAHARTGDLQAAMIDLNHLLEKRWVDGTFIPFTADSEEEALALIIEEKRKSLPFRGIHFMDLRRLNKDPRWARDLVRVLDGQEYVLPANDPRYVLPFPDDVIQNSGMKQNPR